MEEVKPWYTSRAVWGALVAMISTALLLTGTVVTPEMQGTVVELALQASMLISSAVALWGRVAATKRIGSTTPTE